MKAITGKKKEKGESIKKEKGTHKNKGSGEVKPEQT